VKYFLAGGCGFILSSILHRLIKEEPQSEFVVYDNLSSGKLELLDDIKDNLRLKIIIGDVKDLPKLTESMKFCDTILHFCSNADIAKAISDPTIDFYEGTLLTQNILEAMRINDIKKIIYASGSGVYGDHKDKWMDEDTSPMLPVSPYGASKLAGEALISAYCHMFDIEGFIFRFANVIGKNSTHGIILDVINKLKNNSKDLELLGNGSQSKSYVYIDDIIDGIFEAIQWDGNYYNIATLDYITVKQIADIICEEMNLKNVEYHFTSTENKGWKGDIGICRLDSTKLRNLGWENKYTTEQAVRKSIREMLGKE
jgi:UDP-glucose 4-epimerase